MQLELEKKYNLTDKDYYTIQEKCEFIKEINIKDYYLDKNLILAKNKYFLRLRNWIYELKISNYNPENWLNSNEEYNDEDKINELISKFWITTDDVVWIMFVDTFRKKYEYIFNWEKIIIDIDKYQYWDRYEIEINYNLQNWEDKSKVEEKLNNLIEDFRKKLGLTWESDESSCKTITCAMHQNIDLYEIMTK